MPLNQPWVLNLLTLDGYSSSSFNKGIAVGCYIGNHQKKDAARFVLKGFV